MELLRRVIIKSLVIIVPAAALSYVFIEQQKVPLGIVLGGLFGLINLRQLTRNVTGLVGAEKMTFKLVFLSMMRLLMLFTAIFFLIYYRVVNAFGLLAGFTVVFTLILIEGAKVSKSQHK